jgi:hypothetical protein
MPKQPDRIQICSLIHPMRIINLDLSMRGMIFILFGRFARISEE